MALAGTRDAWVCGRVTGWMSQMLRAPRHDLRQGQKRQFWLPDKRPRIPLTSAVAVLPFCRAASDSETLGVQRRPFRRA